MPENRLNHPEREWKHTHAISQGEVLGEEVGLDSMKQQPEKGR